MKGSVTSKRIIVSGAAAVLFILGTFGNAYAVRQIHPPINLPVLGPPAYADEKKPFFARWRSSEVIEAFKRNRLEVTEIESGIFVGAPAARENTIFLIPSYGSDIGSLVASFDTVEDMNESAKYYSKMNEDAGAHVWWIFKKDNILVLISGKVPEERARAYDDVLKGLDK